MIGRLWIRYENGLQGRRGERIAEALEVADGVVDFAIETGDQALEVGQADVADTTPGEQEVILWGGVVELLKVFLGFGEGVIEERGFQDQGAVETPFGGDHLVDESDLGAVDGLEALEEAGFEFVVLGLVFEGDDEGFGLESMLESVAFGSFFPEDGNRSFRFCAVDAGGFGAAEFLLHLGVSWPHCCLGGGCEYRSYQVRD